MIGHLPQAPLVDHASVKQRLDQERTPRPFIEQLPLLVVAVPGHHGTSDKLGEASNAGFGAGRHRNGLHRTDDRQPPHISIEDDRHGHCRADAGVAHACGEWSGNVCVGIQPRGPARASHHCCQGVTPDWESCAYRRLQRRIGIVSGADDRNFAVRFVTQQSGSRRLDAPPHFVGHRLEHLGGLDPTRYE